MGIGLVAVWAILSLTSSVLSRFGICITFHPAVLVCR